MGTLVNLGSEPPKEPKQKAAKPTSSADGFLSSLPVSPQMLGIGAGVIMILALAVWFMFGRGGGGEASSNSPAPRGAAVGASSGTAGGIAGENGPASSTAYPSGGGAVVPATAGGGSVQSSAPAAGGAIPPPPSMGGGSDGGSSVRTWQGGQSIPGTPVMPDGKGGYSPANPDSPFRRQPDGQVIDVRDPPGKY